MAKDNLEIEKKELATPEGGVETAKVATPDAEVGVVKENPEPEQPMPEGGEPPKEEALPPRLRLHRRLREHYPDLPEDDDDALYSALEEHLNGLDEYKNKNSEINKKMVDVFNANPELAGMMKDILKGAPVSVAIARNFDVDALKPQEGDPDYEAWQKGLEERKSKLAEREKYMKELDDNMNLSAKEIEAFKKENNLDDKQTEDVLKTLDDFVANATRYKVTKDMLNHIYRSLTANKMASDAAKKAEIKAKNEKIEAVKEQETKKAKGDGIPKVITATKEKKVVKKPTDPWLQAIDEKFIKRKL